MESRASPDRKKTPIKRGKDVKEPTQAERRVLRVSAEKKKKFLRSTKDRGKAVKERSGGLEKGDIQSICKGRRGMDGGK